jgi:hypothetical protein
MIFQERLERLNHCYFENNGDLLYLHRATSDGSL